MEIKYSRAAKDGLRPQVAGDQAFHDALAEKTTAKTRSLTTREQRRARKADRQKRMAKAESGTAKRRMQAERDLDHAGKLAGIYLGEIPASDKTRERIASRVYRQAENIALTKDIPLDTAMKDVEGTLLNNYQAAKDMWDRKAAARATSKRGGVFDRAEERRRDLVESLADELADGREASL